jgi:hypothetical protein
MPTCSRKQLEAMPGFDPAFHLGEKPGEAAQREAFRDLGVPMDDDRAKWSEKEFQARVTAYAEARGWVVYHTYDSRKSQKGFPDLVLVRGPPSSPARLIFAELKSETGKERKEQAEWRRLLEWVGGNVEAYLFRPSDWPKILEVLK